MKQLIILFCVASAFFTFGQYPYIGSIEILPQNPSTNDEIFLATHVATSNLGQYLGSTVDVSGNTVTVESCYYRSWSTQPQNYYDTISLGFLSAGNYNLNFIGYISTINSDCDYHQSNSENTTFEVRPYLSLNEFSTEDVKIYPNPTSTGQIYISSESKIESFDLVDPQGQTSSVDFSRLNEKYLVELPSFSDGVYVLSITYETGEIIRKRITLM